MRRFGVNEEEKYPIDNKSQIELWKQEKAKGMTCVICGVQGYYFSKSKLMECDCPDSPRPAPERVIEFFN